MSDSTIEKAAAVLGEAARRNVSLAPFTTYRVGGPAALLVEARDQADLVHVQAAVAASGIEVVVVGRGSNLLVADAGFKGLAVVLGDGFASIHFEGATVRAGAAVSLPVLARRSAAESLSGLEWAVGVPGSVGGAVRMNAGGHGSDISATLGRVGLVDLAGDAPAREVPATALDLSYRHSAVKAHDVVIWAEFELHPGDRETAEREIAAIVRWRRANQPGGANAGSVFTNPPGDSAGRLIEAAGLKGTRVGSATVSSRHANFFQVDNGGAARDVVALMETVAAAVLERFGIQLHPEVRLIGFSSPLTGG
ncbi:MAG: UDP-N-acetylmuramate dehydrogenase [Actinomycetota bacterium]|nr:UDP-N-acetylmuramate dehydrogenase [Actinomycetota bacterium]